jgi:hypothetical protein
MSTFDNDFGFHQAQISSFMLTQNQNYTTPQVSAVFVNNTTTIYVDDHTAKGIEGCVCIAWVGVNCSCDLFEKIFVLNQTLLAFR